jgi:hypothetical protein
VRRRIGQLDLETTLIQSQLRVLPDLKGVASIDQAVLLGKHNIFSTLHSADSIYFEKVTSVYCASCSIVRFLSIHSRLVSASVFHDRIEGISSLQASLERLTNTSLANRDPDLDSLAPALDLFFPYKWVFQNVIANSSAFLESLKVVFPFSPPKYRESLLSVFRLMRKFSANEHAVLAVSEGALLFFVRESVRCDFVKDLEFAERSRGLLLKPHTILNIPSECRREIVSQAVDPPQFRALESGLTRSKTQLAKYGKNSTIQ